VKRLKKNKEKFLREILFEEDPGMGLIGLGNSGKGNLSSSHDKYLARYAKKKKR
jgi:hypothetical protein